MVQVYFELWHMIAYRGGKIFEQMQNNHKTWRINHHRYSIAFVVYS